MVEKRGVLTMLFRITITTTDILDIEAESQGEAVELALAETGVIPQGQAAQDLDLMGASLNVEQLPGTAAQIEGDL